MTKGRIHSVETFGTVDGPGIRYIIFTQGCPLRCKYCHNRDTWNPSYGRDCSVKELIEDIKKYKPFMTASNGGLTISGGEPTLQLDFLLEILKEAKSLGIHTCIDTSGFVNVEKVDPILEFVDLVLLDIKHIDSDKCLELTGCDNKNTLTLAEHLSDRNIPVWIRQVLVPGITDDEADLNKLGSFVSELNNVERFELLPYHTMGVHKWKTMNDDYKLGDVPDATIDDVNRATAILSKYNLNIVNKDF